jgi:hypothetical protein
MPVTGRFAPEAALGAVGIRLRFTRQADSSFGNPGHVRKVPIAEVVHLIRSPRWHGRVLTAGQ